MKEGTAARHVIAAMVLALSVTAVVLVVTSVNPNALLGLIMFFPVLFVAGGLIWALTFSDMPFPGKVVRFALYVLLCFLSARIALACEVGFLKAVLTTMIVPALGLFVFALFFPASPKPASKPYDDAAP